MSDDLTNPTVSLQLSGVDTESIIESAKTFDNIGTRQYKIRQILFQSLGIGEQDEMFMSHSFLWRGSKRSCDLLFTNVRSLPDESLRQTADDWKLVVDFPFDNEGHTPVEDLDRLSKFKERNERHRTLVWLPWFFSTRSQGELAKLVVIDRLLLGNNLEQHSKHLSLQDRETARLLLKNQQSALSQRLMQAVEAAYAIRSEPTPGTLDMSYDLADSHFQSLWPTLVLQRPVGATLGEALDHLMNQALTHQYPKHPLFGQEVKLNKDLRQVLQVCQDAARTPEPRLFVEDKALRLKVRATCDPLSLGQMTETHFVLDAFWKNHFNRMLAQSGQPNPTVADLRRWTDQPEPRGLQEPVQNLLILVYADQTNRSFARYGGNYTPSLEDLPNELELQQQQLPDLQDWNEAVKRVADVMGHAVSQLLNASNLATLAARVKETTAECKADCESLPDRIQLVLRDLGVSEADFATCDRAKTAKAVKALLGSCENKEPIAVVGSIARAKLETHATAMGKSLKSARGLLEGLRRTRWDLFAAAAQISEWPQD